jgi:hypothetical protein
MVSLFGSSYTGLRPQTPPRAPATQGGLSHVQKQVSERMRHVRKQADSAHGMIRPARPKREGESVQKQAASLGAAWMRPPCLPRWSRSSPRPVDTLV